MDPSRYHAQMAALEQSYPLVAHAMTTHRSTRAEPLSLADRPYIVEPMTDFPSLEYAAVQKGVQSSWTETMLMLALRAAGWESRTVAYVLPTAGLRDGFVQRRVNPMLDTIPAYRLRLPGGLSESAKKGAENLRLKHFGRGVLMFLGSNKAHEFVEWSADLVVVDEIDHCDQANLALLPDRLMESPYPQRFVIGNPTIPTRGIAAAFNEGDRRRWFQRCDRCGHRQALDWWQHVVRQEDDGSWAARDRDGARDVAAEVPSAAVRPVCARCHRPWDRAAAGALWVPERTGAPRSYQMSRLDLLSQPLSALVDDWRAAQGYTVRLRRFVNSVLGLPYEPTGSGVTAELLESAAVGPAMDHAGGLRYERIAVTAGVDVGAVLHVVISVAERGAVAPDPAPPTEELPLAEDIDGDGEGWLHLGDGGSADAREAFATASVGDAVRRAVFVGTVREWSALEELMARYRVDVCVVDAAPEGHRAQEFRDAMFAREVCSVWLARFHPSDRIGAEDYGLSLDYEAHVATADRTQLLDAALDDLVAARRVLPCDVLGVDGFGEQMRAPKRVLSDRGDRYVWTKAVDHYRLADAYDRLAYDLLQRGGEFHVIGR